MPSDPLLEKAEKFIRSAELLTDEGDLDSAASRLYYAMYFIAQALLFPKPCWLRGIYLSPVIAP